jgi:hypothetical protein
VTLVVGVLVVALGATLAVVLSSGSAAAQVQLQPANAAGPNPFTAPVTKATPSATPSVNLSGGSGQAKAVSGGTVGLYGGTENISSCDAEKMISFLAANPDKARAWAGVESITPSEIPAYVRSLTPVLLRVDTQVTNHGFSNGTATSFQAVLQTGTAVMVDASGVPRVRCSCGNPLLPPTTSSNESFTGTGWSNFQSGNVVIVEPATINVTVIILVDPDSGTWFGRPTGSDGAADHRVPPPTSTTPTPTTTGVPPSPTVPTAPVPPTTPSNPTAPASPTTSATPTLGKPFDSSQQGLGQVRPTTILLGGDPQSYVQNVTWTSWGGATATGTGTSTWVAPGESVSQGSQEQVTVVAFDLGTCDGTLMYQKVDWYFPEHGQTFDVNGSSPICPGNSS